MLSQRTSSAIPAISLVGMHLENRTFPDIKSFNQYLLSRNIRDFQPGARETISIHKGVKPTEIEVKNAIANVILHTLEDAKSRLSKHTNTICSIYIINQYKTAKNTPDKYPPEADFLETVRQKLTSDIAIKDVSFTDGGFYETMLVLAEKLKDGENNIFVMVSMLNNSESIGEHSTSDGNEIRFINGLTGFAFADPSQVSSSYAEISFDDDPAPSQTIEDTQVGEADELQFMRTVLNISNRVICHPPISQKSEDNFAPLTPLFPDPVQNTVELNLKPPLNKNYGMVLNLANSHVQPNRFGNRFFNLGFYLLPFEFNTLNEILEILTQASKRINNFEDLNEFALESLKAYGMGVGKKYALSILGSNPAEIQTELRYAQTHLEEVMETGKDWQTPVGSYFTPAPLGPREKIAFVYPGAFGTYVGMGSEIFYLFPDTMQILQSITSNPKAALNAKVIFPIIKTAEDIERCQLILQQSPTMMISTGTCFSYLYTTILRDIFKVKPDMTFGYSLGEISMMFATGIWSHADAMRTSLETSPIFHERVSGRQTAIREFWKIPDVDDGKPIWSNYILMAPYEKVKEQIKPHNHVYVTHINTPKQVVIGGEDGSCRRIADHLKCMRLKMPYNHAIHCEPVQSEFEAFRRLLDWPVESDSQIPVYSAAEYAPLKLEAGTIAQCFAKMLTQRIDFPQLVNKAYADGARIFIELGAGSNCSKWINAILIDRPHISMSINQTNARDHVVILRMLARLISQRVPIDLGVFASN